MHYGYLILKSADRNTIENLILYEFDTEDERDMWIRSDLSYYGRIIPNNRKYLRKPCPTEDADLLMSCGKKPVRVRYSSGYFSTFDVFLNGYFLNIQPDPCHLSFENSSADFFFIGVTIRFNSRKERNEFIEKNKKYFGNKIRSLKRSDDILKASIRHGLVLSFDSSNPKFSHNIRSIIENFHFIKSDGFLALVCLKDWSHPFIFSFPNKSSSNTFIENVKCIRLSPLLAIPISNFNPIAVNASLNGSIIRASLSSCLDFLVSFLSLELFFSSLD